MKKKICIITGSRSEYGLLRWLMEEIKNDIEFELQIIVTGAHLSYEYGLTYKKIEEDGFHINEKIEMMLSANTKTAIAKSMGLCAIGISDAFKRLMPDLIVVLGDRYELLPICNTAIVMNIPIAHISGGDITEGAIDDMIRHAVTKMANLHFPGVEESARRIIQMGEDPKYVFVVGEPGLDNFFRLKTLSREEIARDLNLDTSKKWILVTYHPETMISLKINLERSKNIITVLNEINNIQVIITYPNADYGSKEIIEIFKKASVEISDKFKLYNNLGQLRYINLMKQIYCMIGNSSSGIIESPLAKVPSINIGNRQKGRFFNKNVICANGDIHSLKAAFCRIEDKSFIKSIENIKNYYGDGNTAVRIKNILKSINLVEINKKKWYRI